MKHIPLTRVSSTLLRAIGYDIESQTLSVMFMNGESIYHYTPVSAELYAEIMNDEHKGKVFVAKVKKNQSIKFTKYIPDPMKIPIEFYECEHDGDLDGYIKDINASGGKVIESRVDHEEETGYVVVEVTDKEAFWAAFKQTSSYGFING